MNIKIHSAEINRIMKTISKCIDTKLNSSRANILITHEDNQLKFRATNGTFHAEMSAPVLGGDGESFCVDGSMFAKVCAMNNGEIEIRTDGKICTIKGVGRTKLPIVEADVPEIEELEGNSITVNGWKLTDCYKHVSYAVATDESRVILTGVLVECEVDTMRMVSLDGFQMSMEETDCKGDVVRAVIPGTFMNLVSGAVGNEEYITLTVSDSAVQAKSDGMLIRGALLSGEYPDYHRILPTEFKIHSKVNAETVRNALKAGGVVNNKQNLVKINVGADVMTISNNGEQAQFEAEVPCETQGDGLLIAFNDKYLMNTMNVLDEDDAEMCFNSAVTPVVVKTINGKGIRLVLPVRVQ